MDKKEEGTLTEKYKPENHHKNASLETVKHFICLIMPVIFAFIGYFISPHIWMLLNKDGVPTELFKFVISIISFLIPASIIFIETRTLNPIINITIRDKK